MLILGDSAWSDPQCSDVRLSNAASFGDVAALRVTTVLRIKRNDFLRNATLTVTTAQCAEKHKWLAGIEEHAYSPTPAHTEAARQRADIRTRAYGSRNLLVCGSCQFAVADIRLPISDLRQSVADRRSPRL